MAKLLSKYMIAIIDIIAKTNQKITKNHTSIYSN